MKKRISGLSAVVLCAAFLLAACDDGSDKPAVGSKLGDCYPDGTCDGILTCVSGVCVDLNEISDTDTNTPDNISDSTQQDNDEVASDNTQSDTMVDTETPDSDTAQMDDVPDNTQPDEVTDTEQPDIDYFGTGTPGEMVNVTAGEFQMGCNESVDTECSDQEFPYHTVTLSAYKIGKYEVTVSEYQKCIDAGACNNNNDAELHYQTNSDSGYCNLGATGKENHPMQCVTWYGAKAYCEYVGQRLPSEAEWEKAARGTDGRKYPWGNEGLSCDYAVTDLDNAGGAGCGTGGTMPVGSKEAGKSPCGAYDMVGNVWEWVNDWYGETYYETTPTNNPTGPESGDARVLRGGSWGNTNTDYFRASCRVSDSPDYDNHGLGFRCAE